MVVSIDQASADALGELPADPVKWPRSLHAQLTESLTRAGAKVIAFDIFFAEPRAAADDARFADAIAHARNVVLVKYLVRDTVPLDRHDASGGRLNVERLASPVPILADTAVGSAPFPLPKLPVRLSQYWKFTSAAGGVPTLPVVAFQVFGLEEYGELVHLAARVRPDRVSGLPPDTRAVLAAGHIETVVLKLKALFESDVTLGKAMLEAASTQRTERPRLLQALIRMYQGPDSEYLNFYGPPRTVRTVPYHEVVSAQAAADPGRLQLQGKAVFVGLSEYLRPEQRDGFHTVFSNAGVDLSGAEIAATAFANLRNDQHVRPLGFLGHVIVVLGGGILVGGICAVFAPGAAAVTTLGLAAAYLALALSRFTAAHSWYPITAPLLLEVPAALVGAILWRYTDTNRQRRQMRAVFSHYLPAYRDRRVAARHRRNGGEGAERVRHLPSHRRRTVHEPRGIHGPRGAGALRQPVLCDRLRADSSLRGHDLGCGGRCRARHLGFARSGRDAPEPSLPRRLRALGRGGPLQPGFGAVPVAHPHRPAFRADGARACWSDGPLRVSRGRRYREHGEPASRDSTNCSGPACSPLMSSVRAR